MLRWNVLLCPFFICHVFVVMLCIVIQSVKFSQRFKLYLNCSFKRILKEFLQCEILLLYHSVLCIPICLNLFHRTVFILIVGFFYGICLALLCLETNASFIVKTVFKFSVYQRKEDYGDTIGQSVGFR